MRPGEGERGPVAFFSVVDRPYLPMAITALRSIGRFHPEATCFVVGRLADDDDAVEMIDRHGLRLLDVDYSDLFEPTLQTRRHRLARPDPRVPWPSECYWWVGVPGVLADLGYDLSCALDGDTFCVRRLGLDEVFDGTSHLAGVAKRNGKINSGVLFFDHRRTQEFDLFATAVEAYRTADTCDHPCCAGLCRVYGDQALLHELEATHGLVVRRIAASYNHMITWSVDVARARNADAPPSIDESHILHLLSKPWERPTRRGRLNPLMCEAYDAWWSFADEVWSAAELDLHFGRRRRLRPDRSLVRLVRP